MHTIEINERSRTELTGINAVMSFNENSVVLDSEDGIICIEGVELNVKKLDLQGGTVIVEGKLTALYYPDGEEKKKSFFSKIFS